MSDISSSSSSSASSVPSPAPGGEGLRTLTFYAMLAGLCPLIPIPFLDDQVLLRVRRRMVRNVAADEGRRLSQRELAALLGDEELLDGCGRKILFLPFKAVLYLIKKIFKKVVILLTLNDCAETFSAVFHEAFLLDRARRRGLLGGEHAEVAAERVRWAVDATLERVDASPIKGLASGVFRGSRRTLRSGARLLTHLGRKGGDPGDAASSEAKGDAEVEAKERNLLSGLLDRLVAGVKGDSDHLERVAAIFDELLESPRETR